MNTDGSTPAEQGSDLMTDVLNSLADELAAATAPSAGRTLSESGGWEW